MIKTEQLFSTEQDFKSPDIGKYLDSIGNPIFKPIKTGPKHVMVIFVPLTLGTLGTLNFRHLT